MNRIVIIATLAAGLFAAGSAHATDLTVKTYKTAASAARGTAAQALDKNSTIQEFYGVIKASNLNTLQRTTKSTKTVQYRFGSKANLSNTQVKVNAVKVAGGWKGDKSSAIIINQPDNS